MKKSIVIVFLILGIADLLTAQTSSDALRYSRIFYSGTSRFQGMAGAFGATGADFSVIATNPAGLGLYRARGLARGMGGEISLSAREDGGTAACFTLRRRG